MFLTFLNNYTNEILVTLQFAFIITFYSVTRMKIRKKFAAKL